MVSKGHPYTFPTLKKKNEVQRRRKENEYTKRCTIPGASKTPRGKATGRQGKEKRLNTSNQTSTRQPDIEGFTVSHFAPREPTVVPRSVTAPTNKILKT